jgi:hypothetical protein
MHSVNLWLSLRFKLLSAFITTMTGLIAVLTPRIDAALAGFALSFSFSFTIQVCVPFRREASLNSNFSRFIGWYYSISICRQKRLKDVQMRRFVGLELSMVSTHLVNSFVIIFRLAGLPRTNKRIHRLKAGSSRNYRT